MMVQEPCLVWILSIECHEVPCSTNIEDWKLLWSICIAEKGQGDLKFINSLSIDVNSCQPMVRDCKRKQCHLIKVELILWCKLSQNLLHLFLFGDDWQPGGAGSSGNTEQQIRPPPSSVIPNCGIQHTKGQWDGQLLPWAKMDSRAHKHRAEWACQ